MPSTTACPNTRRHSYPDVFAREISISSMTSNRPYLIRALFDWIVDNDLTPHLLVNAEAKGVVVPEQFVQDEKKKKREKINN